MKKMQTNLVCRICFGVQHFFFLIWFFGSADLFTHAKSKHVKTTHTEHGEHTSLRVISRARKCQIAMPLSITFNKLSELKLMLLWLERVDIGIRIRVLSTNIEYMKPLASFDILTNWNCRAQRLVCFLFHFACFFVRCIDWHCVCNISFCVNVFHPKLCCWFNWVKKSRAEAHVNEIRIIRTCNICQSRIILSSGAECPQYALVCHVIYGACAWIHIS